MIKFSRVIKALFILMIIALLFLIFSLFKTENYLLASYTLITSIIVIGMTVNVYQRNDKKKWLLIVLNFLGIGQLNINLESGEFALYHIALQIPWINFKKEGFNSPWIISISIPIGVIIFLLFLLIKRLKGSKQETNMNL